MGLAAGAGVHRGGAHAERDGAPEAPGAHAKVELVQRGGVVRRSQEAAKQRER